MATQNRTTVRQPIEEDTFPFGIPFQKSLLRLLTEDADFGHAAIPYLKPSFFENEVLGWAYAYIVRYQAQYNAIPPLKIVQEETKNLDTTIREFYQITLQTVFEADLSIASWLKDQTLDFIKRNIFVASFRASKTAYNRGAVDEAYDITMNAMDKILNTAWEKPDREWFFDDFGQRISDRLADGPNGDTIATGIHELDRVLGGGLSIGELGIWVGYPKQGKSTMLVNHGVQAVRRGHHNTLHIVLEGSRRMVASRYDTVFAQEAYSQVKRGNLSDEAYRRMQFDYKMYQKRMVIRGFTERWNYSAADISEEIKELKRLANWRPELVVVDYGDLLRGRGSAYENETSNQRAAFRDLKSLANRGYGVWTASQARRPDKDLDSNPEILSSRSIAECYDKVRVADFLGTINQTKGEKEANQMRLYFELYRDNEAGIVVPVISDFSRMTINVVRGANARVLPTPVGNAVPLGYVDRKVKQIKAPI